MAGFDFYQSYTVEGDQLTRALLLKLQRVCHTYDLTVHFRREQSACQYHVTVDGNLSMMQASAATLAAALPPFAEGGDVPTDRRKRIRIADRLVEEYWRGVVRIGRMVNETAGRFGGTPNSWFFDTREFSADLDDRLWSFTRALIAYENGGVGPEQIVEEVHTALEWAMGFAIGAREAKGMSYAGMAERLRNNGVIPDHVCRDLLRMKDIRRDAKHRGIPARRDAVNGVLACAVEAIHYVLKALDAG